MKKIKTLEIIKNLIDTEGVEFIPVEKINTIYINYGNIQTSLDNVYNASKKIAKLFDSKVLFHFNGCDILVDKNTEYNKMLKQYQTEQEKRNRNYVEKEFDKASKNLTIKNAKRKTKEVQHLINNESAKEYISNYQLNKLSKTLINTYKSELKDEYLDSMVNNYTEKVLQKIK